MKMILLKYTSHHAHLQTIILDKKRSCLNNNSSLNFPGPKRPWQ